MTTPEFLLPSTVSDIDRRRWQMSATRALAEVLKRADKGKLQPITWQVFMHGGLYGRLDATDYGNVEKDITAAFNQWVELLSLTLEPKVDNSGGGIYLAAQHENWRPKPNLTGARVRVVAQTFKL